MLANVKRLLLIRRPFGLGALGCNSAVFWPWDITNPKRIHIGERSAILAGCHIEVLQEHRGAKYDPKIRVGDDVYIGRRAFITCITGVSIADGCVLSDNVFITDLNHGFDPHGGLIMEQHLVSKGPVKIGANCFLGFGTAVMPGVTLGDWCIVGANSVVTRSFPSYSMIAGSPARLVKVYSQEARKWVEPFSGTLGSSRPERDTGAGSGPQ